MKFSEKIKTYRKDNQITQVQLARKLNVSRKTISSWENDRNFPDILTLIKISDLTGISLDLLLHENQTLLGHDETVKSRSLKMTIVYMTLLVLWILLYLQYFRIFKLPFHLTFPTTLLILIYYLFIYPNWKRHLAVKKLSRISLGFVSIFILNELLFVFLLPIKPLSIYYYSGLIFGTVIINFVLCLVLFVLILDMPTSVVQFFKRFT